jgi:prepilin peptidase CpaA
MLVLAVLFLFPALMSFAASSDLFTMTISNRVSLALLAGFFVMAAWAGVSVETMVWHLACGMTVLTVTFTLFAFGWIGGGDAKLAAATAVWLGFGQVIEYGTVASVLGGLLTLGIVWMRGMEAPPRLAAADWFARLHNKDNGVPYGIALAAAGLLLYPQTAIFTAASGG